MKSAIKALTISVFVLSILFPLFVSYVFRGWVALYTSPRYSTKDIPDLSGKIAIVTGATSGIGKSTARELARKGATVIATCRNAFKCALATDEWEKEGMGEGIAGSIEYTPLDLSSLASVKKFAKDFSKSFGGLHILILNAGVMMPPYTETAEGFELQFGSNYLAHFLLVKLLNNMIKKSKTRIVTVSSTAHEGSYPEGIRFDSFKGADGYNSIYAYGQSKLANILFSNELSRRFNSSGVTANAVHPGMVMTNLSRHLVAIIRKSAFSPILYPAFVVFMSACMDADTGALTQLYLATSPEAETITGKYYHAIATETLPSHHALNETLAAELWSVSEKLTRKFW